LTLSSGVLALDNPWEDDGAKVNVNIHVNKIMEVRFTENRLFEDKLAGHAGLYYSDGSITAQRARDLWNNGSEFDREERPGAHAAFDIRTNTQTRVTLESFKESDLDKNEYGWIDSPTLFAVSDGEDNWNTRAQIHRGGSDPNILSDQFDIVLEPGVYEDRFRIGAAVWLQSVDQFETNKTYKMPLYITVSAD